MLSSEFSNEMGALIRSLQQKVITDPSLGKVEVPTMAKDDAIDSVERAIVSLVAVALALRKRPTE